MGSAARAGSSPGGPGSLATGAAPTQPSTKAAAAAPTLNSDVEMGSLAAAGGGPASDIMQLARVGDVAAMEKLFESGEYDATFADDEGITPLHVRSPPSSPRRRARARRTLSTEAAQWAAINNQYAMCKFLLEHGARINAKGGESVATALQWAAQRCHVYTVNLLLHHGADPLMTDAQGYNTLHISTFNGNVLLVVLLLHQGIPVDVLDSYGHTALMWAAYKGFAQCVDVFLRWGASVDPADEHGFTALHWALVKGNPGCVLKLVEYGADRFAKTDTGKTPAVTAAELNTQPAWHRALRECGYDDDGHPAVPPWPGAGPWLQDRRTFATRFLFLWPFVLVWAAVWALARLPVALGLPVAGAVVLGVVWCAKQVMEYAPSDMRQFHKTVGPSPATAAQTRPLTCRRTSPGWPASLPARSSSSASTGSRPSCRAPRGGAARRTRCSTSSSPPCTASPPSSMRPTCATTPASCPSSTASPSSGRPWTSCSRSGSTTRPASASRA